MRLRRQGVTANGWDPAFFPAEERTPADVVNLGYVVNVIDDPEERAVVLAAAWTLARRVLIVAARLDWEAADCAADFHEDGVITRGRTFQKFYTQEELQAWIASVLGSRPAAAAPGIFYVFRAERDRQSFEIARISRPRRTVASVPGTDQPNLPDGEDYAALRSLISFVAERGRLPLQAELPDFSRIRKRFGSISRAFSLVRRFTTPAPWEAIRGERRADVLTYLALAAFPRRSRFGALADGLRNDIRAFFGSYRAACELADALLYSAGNREIVDRACRSATVGKTLPDALYVHHSAIPRLPLVLRVYEGCARQLAGRVAGLTLVKLRRQKAQVSYLVYEDFDSVAHPVLRQVVFVDLNALKIHHRDYRRSVNPPVLHRKELLIPDSDPRHSKFARLTSEEESLGLLDDGGRIGTRSGWLATLRDHAVTIRGHRVLREGGPVS